jgi:hypothetical protein
VPIEKERESEVKRREERRDFVRRGEEAEREGRGA